MFDVGFSELIVVGLVALLVLGPEKLPGAIRTASLWLGRLRRSFNSIKQDIEREIGADEIRRQLRNEEIMEKYRQAKSQINDTVSTVKREADTIRRNVELEAQAAAGNPLPADDDKAQIAGDTAATEGDTAASPDAPAADTGTAPAAQESAPAPAEPAPAPDPATTAPNRDQP